MKILRLLIKWLKSYNGYNTIDFLDEGVSIKIPIRHSHRYHHLFSKRPYHEIKFRKIVAELIKQHIINIDKNFIDLGAWIGDNSVPWATKIKGIIYAIDPSKANCNYINLLAKINNITNIKTIEMAISDKDETLFFKGNIEHRQFFDELNKKGCNKQIKSTSLDALYLSQIIDNIGFIHLDVEGMEWKVIMGAENIIDKFLPVIAFELHLDTDKFKDDLINFLKQKNYLIYMIDEILPGCKPDCRNFLALQNTKVNNVIKKHKFLIAS